MASTLPYAAHGDKLPIVKISPKYDGAGENRRVVGIQCEGLLLFDHCARVTITVLGTGIANLPSNEFLTERNLKMQFLIGQFQNLVITFSGGEYGSIRYKGSATGVAFLNASEAHANGTK